jgi:membrane protease YdiL (CAAX protease family)
MKDFAPHDIVTEIFGSFYKTFCFIFVHIPSAIMTFLLPKSALVSSVSDWVAAQLFPKVWEPVCLAPIFEELFYRQYTRLFWPPAKQPDKGNGTTFAQNDPGAAFGGYRYWALLSSVLFGLAHVKRSFRPVVDWELIDWNDPSAHELALECSTHGVIFMVYTFLGSMNVFCPLFAKDGLMASIGAHMCGNLLGLRWRLQLCLRILWRLFQATTKVDVSKCGVEADEGDKYL